MVPAGYLAKRVHQKADWLEAAGVTDIYSIGGCISPDFADYIDYSKHTVFWLFNSTELIREIATKKSVDLVETSLFYYRKNKTRQGN